MSATSNAIVIQSSSPEPVWARSISPCTPERLFGLSPRPSSPPSMLSPSKLFGTPSSTRRLNTSQRSTTLPLKQGVGRENIPVMSSLQWPIVAEVKGATRTGQTRKQKSIDCIESASPELEKQRATKQEGKAKRVRARNSKKSEDTGTKVLDGKIVKSSTSKTKDAKRRTSPRIGEETPGELAGKTEDVPQDYLNLDEALKRRIDWTPPKNTHPHIVDLEDDDDAVGIEKTSFGNILSDYRFSEHNSIPEDRALVKENSHPMKRRRIELVEFQAPQEPTRFKKQTKVSKQVSVDSNGDAEARTERRNPQKKKTKTITALVTARYETSDIDPESTIKKFLNLHDDQTSGKAKEDGSRKPPAKQRKKNTAKAKEPEYIVLSPEAVTKSLREQDLLFGTCSQLERDDCPISLRETQKALLESESITSTADSSTSTTASIKTMASRFTSSKGMWSAAARDLGGSMVQPEVLDLVNSPTICPIRRHLPEVETNEVVDLHEKIPQVRPIPNEQAHTEYPIIAKGKQDTTLPKSDEDSFQATELACVPEIQRAKSPPLQTSDVQPSSSVPDMPRFGGYTDAELSKQIAAYRFKAVKGRKKMISLLEKCWRNQHPTAAKTDNISANYEQARTREDSLGISVDLSNKVVSAQNVSSISVSQEDEQTPVAQKRKPRGRPKKAQQRTSPAAPAGTSKGKKSQQTVTDPPEMCRNLPIRAAPVTASIIVEEIEDSEEEVIPSPTRVKQQRNIHRLNTPSFLTLTEDLSLSAQECNPSKPTSSSAHPTTKDIEESDDGLPNLYSQITKAVRAQPRTALTSKQPLRPTWHEKILLYDPIVVEDLATWLNSEGLDLVGEDREVSATFVREWCESKGICCLFRGKPPRVSKRSCH